MFLAGEVAATAKLSFNKRMRLIVVFLERFVLHVGGVGATGLWREGMLYGGRRQTARQ